MCSSFGILPLESPSPSPDLNLMPFITPSPMMYGDVQMTDPKAPKKKVRLPLFTYLKRDKTIHNISINLSFSSIGQDKSKLHLYHLYQAAVKI